MQADQIAALEASVANMAGLEATVNDVDSALNDMATCIAGYASDDMDDYESTMMPEPDMTMTPTEMPVEPETMEPTMMPTAMATDEPTKEPSASPTLDWIYKAAEDYDGAICLDGDGRVFKKQGVNNIDGCANRCVGDNMCTHFVFKERNSDCIGCNGVPMTVNSFSAEYTAYEINPNKQEGGERRQLSELEILRAENAALKEALARVRRN